MPEPEPADRPRSPKSGRNLTLAIVTGLVLAGLIFGTLFTSRPAFFVLVASAVLLAQYELYRVLAERGFRPATTLGVAGGGALLLGAYHEGTSGLSFGVAVTVLATFLWYLADSHRERVVEGIATTLFGVLYVPFLAAHVVMMHALPDGAAVTIAFFGAVTFYDIGAYATGTLFGKHPMAPGISPKKSWEGAVGATVFVFATALGIGPLIDPFDVGSAAALATLAAVLAPIGDLAESLVKRDLQVKDMGGILPGHGGMLDRIDSLLFVAPAAYWLVRWVVF